MTQDEIIELAMDIDGHMNNWGGGIDLKWDTLVEIVQTAIAHEREACAQLCEDLFASDGLWCAAAIRARSN